MREVRADMRAGTLAGTLPADISVDHNGGFRARIPVDVPPGTAGAAPELGFLYSSLAGNGLMGMGWSLSGLSVIERADATIAQDGRCGGVRLDDGDRLTLDGTRLVAPGGMAYFDPACTYQTEIETWHRVVPSYSGVAGRQGPDSFTVYKPDGRVFRYGATPDSQGVVSPDCPSIRVWYLTDIRDALGNTISISYVTAGAGGQRAPGTLSYTGHGKAAARRSVTFDYEGREDVLPGYVAGYEVTTTVRLVSVETRIDARLVSRYRLGYEYGTPTGRSRLVSVTREDGTGAALPATTMTWQGTAAGLGPAAPLDTADIDWGGTLLPMDVNGDGLVDFVNVYAGPDNVLAMSVFIAQPDGTFAPPVTASYPGLYYGGQTLALDANGDGRSEIVYAADADGTLSLTLFVAASQDGRWTMVPIRPGGAGPAGLVSGGTLVAGDVDGDGLADLVYLYSNDEGMLGLLALYSDGQQFSPPVGGGDSFAIPFGGEPVVLDADADGRADIVYASSDDENRLRLTLLRSAGRAGFTLAGDVLPAAVTAGGQLIPMDVNADGNGDLVYLAADPDTSMLVIQVLLNDGVSFTPGRAIGTGLLFGGLVMPASLTGGPVPELLACTPDSDGMLRLHGFALSADGVRPLGELTQPPPGTLAGGNAMPLDLRGRGLSDLVYLSDQGTKQTGFVMSATASYPDLILSITNGLGSQHVVGYAPITDSSMDGDTAGLPALGFLHAGINGSSYGLGAAPQPPSKGARDVLQRVPVPRYVVGTATKTDAIGGQWSVGYRYAGALIDRSGRGWLGFASVTSVDNSAGLTTTLELAQEFPLTQMITRRTLSRAADGAAATVTEYGYTPVSRGPATFIEATSLTVANFGMNGAAEPDTTMQSTAEFDEYGNVTRIDTVGSALASPSTIVQAYRNDPLRWRLGLLTERSEYTDGTLTTLLSRERIEYDPVTSLPAAVHRWDDTAARWLTSTVDYDEFGNVTTTVGPDGSTRSTVYDEEFRTFPASVTVCPAPDVALTSTSEYDPAFGVAVKVTDAAGNASTQTLDGLGRVVGQSRTSPEGRLTDTLRQTWTSQAGMLCLTSAGRLDWSADAWTSRRSFTDGLGRTVRTERDSAESSSPIVTETSYNGAGQPLTQTLAHFAGAAADKMSWTYDELGRVTSHTRPGADGSRVRATMSYPRSDTTVTTVAEGTPQAQQTTVRYGLIHDGNVPLSRADSERHTTSYAYDGGGRLIRLTDPQGITTAASYDTLGRQLSVTVGSGTQTLISRRISYDDMRRQTTETTAAGSVTFTRDGAQRVILKQTSAGERTVFRYDEPDRVNGSGRLTSVVLPDGDVTRYGYDPDGNVTQRDITTGADSYQILNAYTPLRIRLTTRFPDGSRQTSTFGPSGLLTGIDFAEPGGEAQPLLRYSGFDTRDNPTAVTRRNGVTTSSVFDPYGRITSQVTRSAAGQLIFGETVTRGATDSVTAVANGDRSTQYGYSSAGRLTAVLGTSGEVPLSYDAAGNLTRIGGTSIASDGYAATSASGAEEFTASYDAAGAIASLITQAGTISYRYDAEQQLIQAGDTSYRYDHLGRLRVKAGPRTVTRYVAPEYEVVSFADGSRQHTCYIGELGVREFAATRAEEGSPPVTEGIPTVGDLFLHGDYLRSIRAASDADGALTSTISFDVFGNPTAVKGTRFRYGFTGREYDEAAGAYYFGSRYYSPLLRRFMTADDQLGGRTLDRDTVNLYAYVLNDPASLIDTTGHSWGDFAGQVILDVFAIAAGIAIIAATGGAANIVGSTLIGAGVGGLAYDIQQAATGNGANVSWTNYGIQVGIGAATGLFTGAVAVGASAALATTTLGLAARTAAMGAVMCLASSAASVGATTLNNYLSGRSLASGLGVAALSGGLAGILGGAGSTLAAAAGSAAPDAATVTGENLSQDVSQVVGDAEEDSASGIRVSPAEGEASVPEGQSEPEAPQQPANNTDNSPVPQSRAPAQPNQPGGSPSGGAPATRPTFWSQFPPKTNPAGQWVGLTARFALNPSPRLIFGSLRTLILAGFPDAAHRF